jgi:hypothetical protein
VRYYDVLPELPEGSRTARLCGGSVPLSSWLTRDSLLGYLEDFGLTVEVGSDELNHPYGPCILLYASR